MNHPIRPAGPPAWPLPDPAVAEAVQRALADGSWGKYHGPHVPALTEQLAAYHGCEHVILCSSGTAAVELALRGSMVGPGDEVIMSAYDFKANFQDVLTLGAVPVLVDVLPGGWTIDTAQIRDAFSPKSKAILVSHLHGLLADMPAVMAIARERGIPVIEDAAQMPGASIEGRRAGTWGDVGILSFGGSKLITAGRGGALLTSNPEIAQRVKLYTQRGNEAYPLSELQAAVIIPQWAALDEANRHRAENVAWLRGALADRVGLTLPVPAVRDAQPAYYNVGFWYDVAAAQRHLPRDVFSEQVRHEGISLDVGFRALHKTHSARRFRAVGMLEQAARADEAVLKLHHPVLLGDAGDMAQVVAAIDCVLAPEGTR